MAAAFSVFPPIPHLKGQGLELPGTVEAFAPCLFVAGTIVMTHFKNLFSVFYLDVQRGNSKQY